MDASPISNDLIPFSAACADTPERGAARVLLSDSLRGEKRVMIARSDIFLDLVAKARKVAASKAPVLIQGETGTGKELIARIIHDHSPRAAKPLIQVNCAAFSDNLVESELFGHERGAFTGADQRHIGYFERADRGSLLLDEIGEMPRSLQAKLLRVLEEETFERVGGEQLLKVDVRIVATTNRNLDVESAEGRFRTDLFYRLNALTLHLPPLRARKDEIPLLVHHFMERFSAESSVRIDSVSGNALKMLMDYAWPGNIRQLRNVMQHACAMAQESRLEIHDFPALPNGAAKVLPASGQTLAEMERRAILETLREVGGNRTAAALRLGVTTRTLQNKLKLYRECEAA
jgi:two-component system response regulator HydG